MHQCYAGGGRGEKGHMCGICNFCKEILVNLSR